MADVEQVELNWASAEVEDGKLTVELEGEISSAWKQGFETTITLLAGGEWGKVKVKKQALRVSDVTPGSEDKLRHHLESVVEQANAKVRPAENGSAEEESSGDSEDARMTKSFRAFAEGPEAAEAQEGS